MVSDRYRLSHYDWPNGSTSDCFDELPILCKYRKHQHSKTGETIYTPEIDPNGDIQSWGYCLPSCPTETPDPVCLDEPEFPALASNDGSRTVNYTTTYQRGMATVLYDVRNNVLF